MKRAPEIIGTACLIGALAFANSGLPFLASEEDARAAKQAAFDQRWGEQPIRREVSAYFRNCDAARAAGAAPIRRGESGYGAHLDRDGDGVACEPYRGR
ncbi:excalibur calcium-binding domain-containing protein [Citromicrobium sp. WPS32]|uniref:excalibur calcium-binding domain-containing protein n=1 Tax=Citromicrobium sp. WPS32 TaxID=1634517 RepID=UPI0009EC2E60|nr:excalibur calcium-binding domain-containing protein [Citromicrobium sp. WPS32]MAY76567.1 hypothetical protein [Citromicrobium sp.]|tara:strand:+ start:4461 stop:4757 length:297 start_codon:yes stop_codon:yes gene_type:complete